MSRASGWQSVLHGPLRQSATEIALEIAQRLRDPSRIGEITRQVSKQSDLLTRQWNPLSIAYGYAGLALLFGQLDRCFPHRDWDQVAHSCLVPAARSLEASPRFWITPSLFGGVAGVCFVAHLLSRNGNRYQNLIEKLDVLLIEQATELLQLESPRVAHPGVCFSDYDLISGPTGVGACLLARENHSDIFDLLLDRLIFLSESEGGHLRFFVPPELQATERHRELYPHGAVDCGLAHGVPGPLALLALAQIEGIQRPGLCEALRHLAAWMIAQRGEDAWGITWPYAVPFPPNQGTSRAAWCYGSPGVARALWLAGCALDDVEARRTAIEAMRAVHIRPFEARGIPSPILCHGVAGLLQIALRFANDTGDSFFVEMASGLTRQLIGLFEEKSLVGFRDIDPDGHRVDDPGFLNGAAGVALALLSASTDVEPAWDRILLLS